MTQDLVVTSHQNYCMITDVVGQFDCYIEVLCISLFVLKLLLWLLNLMGCIRHVFKHSHLTLLPSGVELAVGLYHFPKH